jgi:hypothetical protein
MTELAELVETLDGLRAGVLKKVAGHRRPMNDSVEFLR